MPALRAGVEGTLMAKRKPQLEPLLLTTDEVASLLGTSRATVYRLLGKHALPVRRVGRRLKIPRSALINYCNPVVATEESASAHV